MKILCRFVHISPSGNIHKNIKIDVKNVCNACKRNEYFRVGYDENEFTNEQIKGMNVSLELEKRNKICSFQLKRKLLINL